MLVSCLMPTANRRRFIPTALACFAAQDWPEKELIVIDDGSDKVEDLCAGVHRVTYKWTQEKRAIGTKLNDAARIARGDVLIRFDDDDWSAADRISEQVTRLIEQKKQLCGYHSMLFWDIERNEGSRYGGAALYALGTSLCFTRDYWQRAPFKNCSLTEDSEFIRPAQKARSITSADAQQRMVARYHSQSVNKRTTAAPWPRVDASAFPEDFFRAIGQ